MGYRFVRALDASLPISGLPASGHAILGRIALHTNDETGRPCTVSIAYLARVLGLEPRSVQLQLAELCDRSYVIRVERAGRTSELSLNPDRFPAMRPLPGLARTEGCQFDTAKPPSPHPRSPHQGWDEGGFAQNRTEQEKEQTPAASSDADEESEYRAFIALYPRPSGCKAARAAYRRARRKLSADALICALKASRFTDDPRYIPGATAWLDGERWRDEMSTEPLLFDEEQGCWGTRESDEAGILSRWRPFTYPTTERMQS